MSLSPRNMACVSSYAQLHRPIARVLAPWLVAWVLLVATPGQACEADDECRFHRICVNGVCVNPPEQSPAKTPLVVPGLSASLNDPSAPAEFAAPPPVPLVRPNEEMKATEALVPGWQAFLVVIDQAFVLSLGWLLWRRRRARLKDLEGARLVWTGIACLNGDTLNTESCWGDLAALEERLSTLESRAKRVPLTPDLRPMIATLFSHPRFEELAGMWSDYRGRELSFDALRARLDA